MASANDVEQSVRQFLQTREYKHLDLAQNHLGKWQVICLCGNSYTISARKGTTRYKCPNMDAHCKACLTFTTARSAAQATAIRAAIRAVVIAPVSPPVSAPVTTSSVSVDPPAADPPAVATKNFNAIQTREEQAVQAAEAHKADGIELCTTKAGVVVLRCKYCVKGARKLEMLVNGVTGSVGFGIQLHIQSGHHLTQRRNQETCDNKRGQPNLHQFMNRESNKKNLLSSYVNQEWASACYGFSSADPRVQEMWDNIKLSTYRSLNFKPINLDMLGPVQVM